jgi:hypothetical protein
MDPKKKIEVPVADEKPRYGDACDPDHHWHPLAHLF